MGAERVGCRPPVPGRDIVPDSPLSTGVECDPGPAWPTSQEVKDVQLEPV